MTPKFFKELNYKEETLMSAEFHAHAGIRLKRQFTTIPLILVMGTPMCEDSL